MTTCRTVHRYNRLPIYVPTQGTVDSGWHELARKWGRSARYLCIDGVSWAHWHPFVDRLISTFADVGLNVRAIDTRDMLRPWPDIQLLTTSELLQSDGAFERIPGTRIEDLFVALTVDPDEGRELTMIYGPGAALFATDSVWYLTAPKRSSESEMALGELQNLGQTEGPGTMRRLFYVDWPIQDRHREEISGEVDLWVDVTSMDRPTFISGQCLSDTARSIVRQPFRVRPFFSSTSWGGSWGKSTLGFDGIRNTGLGYELISPESGVLIGSDASFVEIPFEVLVSLEPEALLGQLVSDWFGPSFPIRFDYLDTAGGGNLSVHVHPQDDYMRHTFGWPYAQHESYYVMRSDSPGSKIFLGVRAEVNIETFQQEARLAEAQAVPFDIERYVMSFPAVPHQLYLIPAGTPHGSGAGNVVLEISATPYLYSLRFYDWLREDSDGSLRQVHLNHAFANLSMHRTGSDVASDLIQTPVPIRSGEGWHEELIGSLPDLFYEVRRLNMRRHATVPLDTEDRFHVLSLVSGTEVVLRTDTGYEHRMSYAETILVPAAVGTYRIVATGGSAMVVAARVIGPPYGGKRA